MVLICFGRRKFSTEDLSFAKLSIFNACSDLILRALHRASALVLSKYPAGEKSIALEWCKQEQDVEESEVSCQREPIFHTLINNCVENLIVQKYLSRSSAQLLPAASSHFLTGAER
jgi:hypothetical protein